MIKQFLSFKNNLILSVIIIFLFTLAGCEKSVDPIENDVNRGTILTTDSLDTYSPDLIKFLLEFNDVELPFDLPYSVEVHKVTYLTVDENYNYHTASGAVFIPVGQDTLPLYSLQHGTQPHRERVASVDPFYSLTALVATSMGYLSCSADYLGLGDSDVLHPYHHEETSASVVIDFIRASKQFCTDKKINLNGQLFLSGYSEGGYVTMAAQKEIEKNCSNEFTITASAPMAGAYDLVGTADHILETSSYGSPTFLSYLILAYNNVYKWNRLSEIFKSPYDTQLPILFDGTKSTSEIHQQLPSQLKDLLHESFFSNYLNGSDTQVISALESNSLLDWTPVSPTRLYHGNADVTVPYQNSVTALSRLKANGAVNIKLVTIEGGNHMTSFFTSIIDMVNWFGSFRTAN